MPNQIVFKVNGYEAELRLKMLNQGEAVYIQELVMESLGKAIANDT